MFRIKLKVNKEREVGSCSIPKLPIHHGHHESPIAVKGLDQIHVILRQLKVENVPVLLNPGRSDTLGDDDDPSLEVVPEQHLGSSLVAFGSQLGDFGVLQKARLSFFGPGPIRRTQGAVSSQDDALLFAEVVQLLLVQVGVAFNLVSGRLDL